MGHRYGVDLHIILVLEVKPGFGLSSLLVVFQGLPLTVAELPEPICLLEYSHRLVHRIFYQGLDVASRVAIDLYRKILEVLLC